MSKLITFIPTIDAIANNKNNTIAHFTVMIRNARNGERYHLDAPVRDQRNGAHNRSTRTDNRRPIIDSNDVDLSDKRLVDHLYDDVDMFRVKVNDKGAYMIDIILRPNNEDK